MTSSIPWRIALFQGPAESGGVARNLELLETTARKAADQGARLLICPEMFLTGYNIGSEAARRLAEPVDGPSARRAAAIATENGIALLYGYPEQRPDGRVYNAALLLDDHGQRLANYRKTHLFGDLDHAMFEAGAEPVVTAELDGLRIGILICYDVEFPENVRMLALAGVDIVTVPTALMRPFDIVARNLVPIRAFENQLYLAYANRCGNEADLSYCGLSCVVGPDGSDLARAGGDEALIFADLSVDALAHSRRAMTYLRDRRPEIYGSLSDGLSRI